jgi:ribosome maturation factor RimP
VKKWAGWPAFFVALTDRAADTEPPGDIFNIMRNNELEDLVAPEIEKLGFECVKLEVAGGSRNPVLRLYIDKPDGVSIDDCSLVSRTVGLLLEEKDPFPGRYLLEVSSPGSDRPLVTEAHFQRFSGETAKVQVLRDSQKTTYIGRIRSCGGGLLTLALEDDGETVEIRLENVVKASLAGQDYKIDKKRKQEKRAKRAKRSAQPGRSGKNKGDQR